MLKLLIADLKLLVRNRQLLFWSFAFPLIFATIFGFFFSSTSSGAGNVAFIDNAHTSLSGSLHDALGNQGAFKIEDQASEDKARDLIKNGKEIGAIIIPAGFGSKEAGAPTQVKVLYDPGSLSGKAAIDGVVGAILTETSFEVQNVKPIFGITDVAAGTDVYTYFDYVLVGLLGMALMNSAIQGLAISLSHYREDQILKRITTTPLSLWKFMLAEVFSRLIVNIAQVLVILAVGIYGFHSHIGIHAALPLVGLSIVAASLFQLIGFGIASISKTSDAAQGMAQAVTVPMMFLTGVFFPIDGLPGWLHAIVQFLPLAPLLHMMRSVALGGGHILDNPSDVYIVVGWIVVLLFFVRYKFKLSEE